MRRVSDGWMGFGVIGAVIVGSVVRLLLEKMYIKIYFEWTEEIGYVCDC